MGRRFDKKKKNGGTTENGIPTPPNSSFSVILGLEHNNERKMPN